MMMHTPQAFTVDINPVDYSATASKLYAFPVTNANGTITVETQTTYFSFESRKTLALKARNITASGYGGVAGYALNTDDFRGVCGQGTFPLMRAIQESFVAPKISLGGLEDFASNTPWLQDPDQDPEGVIYPDI